MNGTNSMDEADRHPMHMCPVCFRKARHNLHFHPQDRYARLLYFYEKYGFKEQAEFVDRRLNPPEVEFLTENQ